MKKILTIILALIVTASHAMGVEQSRHPKGRCSRPICFYPAVEKMRQKQQPNFFDGETLAEMAKSQKPVMPKDGFNFIRGVRLEDPSETAKKYLQAGSATRGGVTRTAWDGAKEACEGEFDAMPVNFGFNVAEDSLRTLPKGGFRAIIPGLGILKLAKNWLRNPKVYPLAGYVASNGLSKSKEELGE